MEDIEFKYSKKKVGNYIILLDQCLGKGSFGLVYKAYLEKEP